MAVWQGTAGNGPSFRYPASVYSTPFDLKNARSELEGDCIAPRHSNVHLDIPVHWAALQRRQAVCPPAPFHQTHALWHHVHTCTSVGQPLMGRMPQMATAGVRSTQWSAGQG